MVVKLPNLSLKSLREIGKINPAGIANDFKVMGGFVRWIYAYRSTTKKTLR
jgi:hypothetical protein